MTGIQGWHRTLPARVEWSRIIRLIAPISRWASTVQRRAPVLRNFAYLLGATLVVVEPGLLYDFSRRCAVQRGCDAFLRGNHRELNGRAQRPWHRAPNIGSHETRMQSIGRDSAAGEPAGQFGAEEDVRQLGDAVFRQAAALVGLRNAFPIDAAGAVVRLARHGNDTCRSSTLDVIQQMLRQQEVPPGDRLQRQARSPTRSNPLAPATLALLIRRCNGRPRDRKVCAH